jgi:hypothetical protein
MSPGDRVQVRHLTGGKLEVGIEYSNEDFIAFVDAAIQTAIRIRVERQIDAELGARRSTDG